MSTAKRLALIAAGYVLSVVGGLAAVALNEWRMPAEIAETSPGMVAFGDVILFILATGFLGLVPTWLLLRLCIEKAPRATLAAELLVAAMGPASWLALVFLVGARGPNPPEAMAQWLGLLIAFGAIPRIVVGPVLVVIEAATFIMIRGRRARALLVAAMLMDIAPLGTYALHMAGHR